MAYDSHAAFHKFRSYSHNYRGHFCRPMTNHGKAKNIRTQSMWWVLQNDIPGLKEELQMFTKKTHTNRPLRKPELYNYSVYSTKE